MWILAYNKPSFSAENRSKGFMFFSDLILNLAVKQMFESKLLDLRFKGASLSMHNTVLSARWEDMDFTRRC